MKKNIPKYLFYILKKYPNITSGRKNYIEHHERVSKNLLLTKKHLKYQRKGN